MDSFEENCKAAFNKFLEDLPEDKKTVVVKHLKIRSLVEQVYRIQNLLCDEIHAKKSVKKRTKYHPYAGKVKNVYLGIVFLGQAYMGYRSNAHVDRIRDDMNALLFKEFKPERKDYHYLTDIYEGTRAEPHWKIDIDPVKWALSSGKDMTADDFCVLKRFLDIAQELPNTIDPLMGYFEDPKNARIMKLKTNLCKLRSTIENGQQLLKEK